MKLVKAMKKLKFWSSKKRKKKDYHQYSKLSCEYNPQPYYYSPPRPPPPPTRPAPPRPSPSPLPLPDENCQCHFCQPAEPSAPPLPPWLEGISDNSNWVESFTSPIIISNEQEEVVDHSVHISHEIVFKTSTNSSCCSALLQSSPLSSSSALQQYSMSPVSRERAGGGGLFGCVIDVGALLYRCFLPCLHISERGAFHDMSSVSRNALPHQNMEKKSF